MQQPDSEYYITYNNETDKYDVCKRSTQIVVASRKWKIHAIEVCDLLEEGKP